MTKPIELLKSQLRLEPTVREKAPEEENHALPKTLKTNKSKSNPLPSYPQMLYAIKKIYQEAKNPTPTSLSKIYELSAICLRKPVDHPNSNVKHSEYKQESIENLKNLFQLFSCDKTPVRTNYPPFPKNHFKQLKQHENQINVLSSPVESDHPVCAKIREGFRVTNNPETIKQLIKLAETHGINDLVKWGKRKLSKLKAQNDENLA